MRCFSWFHHWDMISSFLDASIAQVTRIKGAAYKINCNVRGVLFWHTVSTLITSLSFLIELGNKSILTQIVRSKAESAFVFDNVDFSVDFGVQPNISFGMQEDSFAGKMFALEWTVVSLQSMFFFSRSDQASRCSFKSSAVIFRIDMTLSTFTSRPLLQLLSAAIRSSASLSRICTSLLKVWMRSLIILHRLLHDSNDKELCELLGIPSASVSSASFWSQLCISIMTLSLIKSTFNKFSRTMCLCLI